MPNRNTTSFPLAGTDASIPPVIRRAGLQGFRFHDLRHTAITELAEAGAPDATLMAIAGHMSRRMLEQNWHEEFRDREQD